MEQKTIGIVGLGLIGASMAMAIKQRTPHLIYGYDTCPETLLKSHSFTAGDLTDDKMRQCDIIIIALYPEATVDFVREKAKFFKKGGLVVDCCGVKKRVCLEIPPLARQYDFVFIGGHPMAGIEHSGIDYAFADLFCGASMILCPASSALLDMASDFFLSLGFGMIKLSNWEEHDKIISYTSQLAHIVSSAYIKCDGALMQSGFSAGSFRDMTRVARLNEHMWTELFFENREALIHDTEQLISHMQEFEAALRTDNREEMRLLLKLGRQRKELVDNEKNCRKDLN